MSASGFSEDRSARRNPIEGADVGIAAQAGRARHHPAVRALGVLSDVADQVPSMVVCGTVLAAGLATRRPRVAEAGARMLASVLVAAALKSGVKTLVSRTRPRAVLDGDAYAFEIRGRNGRDEHSFPSGHTAGAFAAAGAVARVYPASRLAAYAAASSIAVVQIPRGKHYPADLLAGMVVGLAAEAFVAVAASVLRGKLENAVRPT